MCLCISFHSQPSNEFSSWFFYRKLSIEHSPFLTGGVSFSCWGTARGFPCPGSEGRRWCAAAALVRRDVSVHQSVPVSKYAPCWKKILSDNLGWQSNFFRLLQLFRKGLCRILLLNLLTFKRRPMGLLRRVSSWCSEWPKLVKEYLIPSVQPSNSPFICSLERKKKP